MAVTAKLKKVGGSVMLAIPPALLKVLGFSAESSVDLTVETGKLVVQTKSRPHYTLDELLEGSDKAEPPSEEEREWLNSPSTGREII